MEWDNKDYTFTYNLNTLSVGNVWNSDRKLIARSYKGFRDKLGILPASRDAQEFVNLFKVCKVLV